jgi:2-dehydro-3-deoxyphosphogluconate aldolase/(4S)-4-hydroxy-2-oxoglutarate aldolase
MFDDRIAGRIEKCGVVAVLTVEREEDAVPLARALLEGGIEAMELTLRTPAAVDALRAVVADVPEMLAGVGTVLTAAQVAQVHEAGAAFAVAPGTNPTVLQAAKELGLPFAPGVATPSEMEQAIELGCRILKFFPAEPIGGMPYLKSMATPYAHLGIRFMPLGGVNAQNMVDYLKSPLVLGVGGSWIASKDAIAARDWDGIAATAREATGTAKKVRAKG